LKTTSGADVSTLLRGLRRRWVVRRFLDASAAGALAAAGAWLAADAALHFSAPPHGPLDPLAAAGAVLGAALLAGAIAVRRWPALPQVAVLADRRGATKDRVVTALALESGSGGEVEALARAECAAYLARTDLRPLFPLHPPRAGAWLVVPLVALALLRVDFSNQRAAARATAAQAQASVAGTAQEIEQLARKVEQLRERDRSEALRQLAEQLQRSAERLRAQSDPAEAQKSALRELSTLEDAMRELQRQPSPAEEMKELARALAPLPGMQDVLKALNEKNLADAQRALDRAKEAQKTAPERPGGEQIEKALRDAVRNLAERRQLSQALQKLAEQMQQHGAQSAAQQAMQHLSQMLQQAQQGGASSDDSAGQRQMTMKELISALENMKFGEGDGRGQQGGGGRNAGDGPQVAIQSFAQSDPNHPPQPGDAAQPSGKPGSERDLGTSATPFGGKSAPQDKGGELALKGQLGQGETLSMMLPSAGDKSRSARRYKDLYEAAAAAAQDTVQQENIPLGSRFLIKRYFDSIRPQE